MKDDGRIVDIRTPYKREEKPTALKEEDFLE